MSKISNARQLYKYLLREIDKLPQDARPYYRFHVRQQFNSHSDEEDQQRISQIIDQSIENAKWLVYQKYGIKEEITK